MCYRIAQFFIDARAGFNQDTRMVGSESDGFAVLPSNGIKRIDKADGQRKYPYII
jgi:hypothetical protein